MGRYFRLLGTTGPLFVVVKEYLAADFIRAVLGHTLDGKRQTYARVEDVIFLD